MSASGGNARCGDDGVVCGVWCVMVQLVPRVGFKAKKKELDAFKAAIEMYEADPEMNPMTVVQVEARVSACLSACLCACFVRMRWCLHTVSVSPAAGNRCAWLVDVLAHVARLVGMHSGILGSMRITQVCTYDDASVYVSAVVASCRHTSFPDTA